MIDYNDRAFHAEFFDEGSTDFERRLTERLIRAGVLDARKVLPGHALRPSRH